MEPSAGTAEQLEKYHRQTVVIILAEVLFVLVLLGVVLFRPVGDVTGSVDPTALMVLVIFIAAASFVVRRVLNRWDRYKDAMLIGGSTGLLRSLRNTGLILASFGEVIGVIGFIAGLVGGEVFDTIRATAVALIVFAFNFPRKAAWERIFWSLEESPAQQA
jgi:hypothetical protein